MIYRGKIAKARECNEQAVMKNLLSMNGKLPGRKMDFPFG